MVEVHVAPLQLEYLVVYLISVQQIQLVVVVGVVVDVVAAGLNMHQAVRQIVVIRGRQRINQVENQI